MPENLQKPVVEYLNGFVFITGIANGNAHTIGIKLTVQQSLTLPVLPPAAENKLLKGFTGLWVHQFAYWALTFTLQYQKRGAMVAWVKKKEVVGEKHFRLGKRDYIRQ
jgi:hypothetical protein